MGTRVSLDARRRRTDEMVLNVAMCETDVDA